MTTARNFALNYIRTLARAGGVASDNCPAPVAEDTFKHMLCRERKRSERSRKGFLLMTLRPRLAQVRKAGHSPWREATERLAPLIRETDTLGWYEANVSLGVIFTELGNIEPRVAIAKIRHRVNAGLQPTPGGGQAFDYELSFFIFPDGKGEKAGPIVSAPLYPDLFELDGRKKTSLIIKRSMDIVGSACAMLCFAPLFLGLAVLVKLTSKGPIFFRQWRLGQFGKPFVFVKFRSMHVATDTAIHQQYVTDFIAGKAAKNSPSDGKARVYKITNDPRVTFVGKFMRRTSLDELPQFWNVLMGEMSLVGPRPPIPYEIDAYDLWHHRRVLEAKPGITGLWQVQGRSRTTFDEMVRLDLRYAKTWSPLGDLRILLQTPRAVFSGDGAY